MKRFAVFLFVLLFISKAFSQTNELTDAQIKGLYKRNTEEYQKALAKNKKK
ncbi:MAG: hypothetical protein J6U06_08690 [Spirochaetaceae bacterium]|nr:hypothetical protein [Spirochaetaceae bacterium]